MTEIVNLSLQMAREGKGVREDGGVRLGKQRAT